MSREQEGETVSELRAGTVLTGGGTVFSHQEAQPVICHP